EGALDLGFDLLGPRGPARPRSLPAPRPDDLLHRQVTLAPLLPHPFQDPFQAGPAEDALHPRPLLLSLAQAGAVIARTGLMTRLVRLTLGSIPLVGSHAAPRSYAETMA